MYLRIAKRLLDIVLSSIGLALLAPVFAAIALLVKLDSKGPVFFRQERMGQGLQPFRIYKFRTMVIDADRRGGMITVGEDPRITRIGRLLRKTKLDELPQLINVISGDMSFVGPRPEVRKYVDLFRPDYEEILSVRPGVTDLASLKYCDEQTMLGLSENPEQEYVRHVLPEKIALAKEYIQRSSFLFDVWLIVKTTVRIFGGGGACTRDSRIPANRTHTRIT